MLPGVEEVTIVLGFERREVRFGWFLKLRVCDKNSVEKVVIDDDDDVIGCCWKIYGLSLDKIQYHRMDKGRYIFYPNQILS